MKHDGIGILGFRHELQIFDKATGVMVDKAVEFNRIPQAGLEFLLLSPFGLVAPITNLYCAVYTKNFQADANTSAADLPTLMGEFTAYSETARPLWVPTFDGAGTLDNEANKAIFTPTQDAIAYGSVIVSSPIKGSPTGLLLSVVKFTTVKPMSAGQEAKLLCGLTYIPSNAL